jgi:hypothetical protein
MCVPSRKQHTKESSVRRQELVRAVNDEIDKLNDQSEPVDGLMTVVCECGSESCHDQVELPKAVYEAVRASANQFVLKPGHETAGSDWLVECELSYYVTERRVVPA